MRRTTASCFHAGRSLRFLVLRLLHVRSLFRSIAKETGRAVLAGLRVRPLERRGKFRPNRNRRGSPDQRREAIQRRKTLRTRVSAVRTQSANPFENRRKSASSKGPERVRKGDGGGATGIRTLETVSRLHTFQACAFDHSATAPLGACLSSGLRNMQANDCGQQKTLWRP